MTITYPAADAQNHLADLWDRAVSDRDVILLHRGEHSEDLALIATDELRGLMETAHLLRSPANARRLLAALGRAQAGTGGTSQTAAELRGEFGLSDEKAEGD